MIRRALLVVVVLAATALAGCGDDGDGAGAESRSPDLAALSGGAPAAKGAGLDAPPGPADRVALDSFDVGDLGFG
jgi:hypothetical protein